jgi:Protein of unknown function (DUF707)
MSKLAVILTTNKAHNGVGQYSALYYDLFVIDYETEGSYKYHAIKNLIEARDMLNTYDYFWFPDYDIKINDADLRKLVKLSRASGFDLSQPSLSSDSFTSWDITKHVPNSLTRETNFVEIMCPLFTSAFLKAMLWTFDLNFSGWGLDHLWFAMSGNCKLGIIDAVQVTHAKPISSHTWILPNGKTPLIEMQDLLIEFGIGHE